MIPYSRLLEKLEKLLENHTLHSGAYLYSPYMAVNSHKQRTDKSPPPPPHPNYLNSSLRASSPLGGYLEKYTREWHARLASLAQIGELNYAQAKYNTILCQCQGTGSPQPSVYSPQIPKITKKICLTSSLVHSSYTFYFRYF